jgi:hypothetical protein
MKDYSLTFVITASREEEAKTLRHSLNSIKGVKGQGCPVSVILNLDKIKFEGLPEVDLVTNYELVTSFADMRNQIIKHVTTDFFFILDADEYFLNLTQCYREICKCLEWNMLYHDCECIAFPANHMQEWRASDPLFNRDEILRTIPHVLEQSDHVKVEDEGDYIKFSKLHWPSFHRRLFNTKTFLGYSNEVHEHPETKQSQFFVIPFSAHVTIQHLKSFDQQHKNVGLYERLAK